MQTGAIYLQNTYLFELEANVIEVGQDEVGKFIILDRTVFYPQGGGQPSDQGSMESKGNTVQIVKVVQKDGVILHYSKTEPVPFMPGERVVCHVNPELRLLHAAAHTAGHVLAHCVEYLQAQLKSKKAYHFLEGPYVEFEGELKDPALEAEVLAAINAELEKVLGSEIQVIDSVNADGFRSVQIGSFPSLPCGGTHLKDIKGLNRIKATKFKRTKSGLRVSYQFERGI